MIKCDKCESTNIELRQDSRGMPDAFCSECGARIKKMSITEVIDYYETRSAVATPPPTPTVTASTTNAAPCPYCTERYVIVRGNPGTREIHAPLDDIKFCPMCGRELKESDKNVF